MAMPVFAQQITIRAMMEPHPTTSALKEMAADFEKDTGIKVILEEVPYDSLTSKALLNFASQSSDYDVVMDDWVYGVGFANAGYIAPLNVFAENKEISQYFDSSDFVPGYFKTLYIEDSLYGLPIYGESTFLMYRKDLFEECQISAPQTMDDLMKAAQTIYEKSNGQTYGITLRGRQGIHNVYVWAGFLWAFGGRWFDENGNPVINSPEAIKATEFYAEILQKYGPPGAATYGWEENRIVFQNGEAAMTIDATVNGALAEDPKQSKVAGKVGYTQVPKAAEKLYGSPNSVQVHALYVSSFSKNKEAAWKFVSWATSADVQKKSLELYPNSGVTSLSAINSDKFQELYGAFSEAMIEAINNGNFDYLPHITEAGEVIDLVGIAVSEVLSGTKNAQDALDEANAKIMELLGK